MGELNRKLLKKLQLMLIEHLPEDAFFVLGVSGGSDSTALLFLMNSLRSKYENRLAVAHFNHKLRASADLDEEFVRNTCVELSLPFFSASPESSPPAAGIEAWAREARYKFLTSVLNQCLNSSQQIKGYILTAHTLNDVGETLLMKLISNRELKSIHERDDKRKVIRPLLDATKEELQEYLKMEGVKWREDPSNATYDYLRNKIRLSVVPVLKEIEPSVEAILHRQALTINEDLEALDRMALEVLEKNFDKNVDFENVDEVKRVKRVIEESGKAVGLRVSRELFKRRFQVVLGRRQAEEFYEVLIAQKTGAQIFPGYSVKRENGKVIIRHISQSREE